jgi:hypothetical protein
MLLLLHVVIPVRAGRPHSLRIEVATIQQQLHLLRAPMWFTPTDEFVLWQLLNHDRMNKLSQLSASVSFPLRVTCLDPFAYMLPKVSIQSIDASLGYLELFTWQSTAGPREVLDLEVRERPPPTLRNVDGGPPGGAGARGPRAPTINAKKRRRWAPRRCRSWRSGSTHHQH